MLHCAKPKDGHQTATRQAPNVEAFTAALGPRCGSQVQAASSSAAVSSSQLQDHAAGEPQAIPLIVCILLARIRVGTFFSTKIRGWSVQFLLLDFAEYWKARTFVSSYLTKVNQFSLAAGCSGLISNTYTINSFVTSFARTNLLASRTCVLGWFLWSHRRPPRIFPPHCRT
jgi:hypothetical protein